MLNKKVTFIGGGNMAEGIIRGMLNEKAAKKEWIEVYDIVERRLDYLKETYGVEVAAETEKAIEASDIVFIAVRPQDAQGVLEQIRDYKKTAGLIISICAGITLEQMEEVLENFVGSGMLLQMTDLHPFQQVDRMTSPAGVTIEGVSVLNECGLTGILMKAVKTALNRTKDLS